ncbi:hypothetical protein COW36_09225 [bacterium (Candidatus Blackallbacteria) CG17_big_fil_post_rev_8_21_14_2_50_48_46]|uniref:SMP-30/Gluconolactonase/LRE-like region domain-containing protein n=1 Tax=bacterium (Candidatus Blackallbacteria) CG17_big_fil_post_rev_8_21_14_2_50_48_46 TaxID=2014261 RepID=A0A2M7G5T5_9BACT|nr:MAG: hypothetical protein COW64_23825 [bacterium (Candidatus Blackallbacteria) CG18_big_fil_WC_8_21_14_2_50_49_26]PIW17347.1 MAG: hypothetical protein COW36_09225 [bacterium (Candidatus Blackallbacteria) CG17_big_fil_post_rev_8_21_14_2_50_48_46]
MRSRTSLQISTLLALSLTACGPSPTLPGPQATTSNPPVASPSAPVTVSPSPVTTPTPPLVVPPVPGQSATPAPLPSAEATVVPVNECGSAAVLKELPLPEGFTPPAGMQARLFETPFKVGDIVFDDHGQAQVFSSDRTQKSLTSTDACGGWKTAVSSELLAGINGKTAVPLKTGTGYLTVVDYYPDGGNNFGGMFNLLQSGSYEQLRLKSDHAGLQDIIRQPRTDLLLPAELKGIEAPSELQIQVLRSNYTLGPLGSLFYGPEGSLYIMTSSLNRQTMLKLDPLGKATVYANNELLRGPIWRHGAVVNGVPVVSMDYAPAAGVQTQGIYQFNADGGFAEWKTAQAHAGLHDVLAAPQGGIYFTDFENDNVWYKADAASPETGLLDANKGQIPGALASLAYDAANQNLFYLNRIEAGSWWGSGPGVRGVYKVADGVATLYAQAAEGTDWDGLAYADKGPLGAGLYTLERQTGNLLKIQTDGTATPVVKGLPKPSELRFDPQTGNLTVVCEGQYLVQIGKGLTPLKLNDLPANDAGWYFTDFENDNLWYLPNGSTQEVAVLDSEIPPGLFSLTYLDSRHEIYALNSAGGWPFGGTPGVYLIQPNGTAKLLAEADKDTNFGSLAAGGGQFDKALFWTDPSKNRILKGGPEYSAPVPYLTGVPKPGYLAFSPQGDRLLTVVNEGKGLLWVGPNLGTPKPSASATPSPTASVIPAADQLIFDNGNILAVFNRPTAATTFHLEKATLITYLQTYHWNEGQGSTGGTVSLEDNSGKIYGPWKVQTRPGQGGVPNAYWFAEPQVIVPAGTYHVLDSEPSTWSQNSANGGQGMALVRGIPQ